MFGKTMVSLTGEWIRGHMLEIGRPDYPYRMWKQYRQFLETARETLKMKAKPPTYLSFLRYTQILRDIGLILVITTSPSPIFSQGRPRTFYVLNRDRLDDPAWLHPYQHQYQVTSTKWRTAHGLPVGKKARRMKTPTA
ncbi:MAG: hypothetical protein QW223_01085 [Candidatus Caldarchaeum sp.]